MDDNHEQTLLHTGSGNMGADVSRPSSRPLSALAPHRSDGAIKEQRSSIHTFYHQLLGLFRDALKAGGCPHCLNGRARTKAEQNLSRLYMWAQGLDLDHIERNVDEGSELQSSVAGALAEIAKIVTSGIVYNPSAAVPRSNSLDLFPFGLHHKEQIDMSLTSRYFDDGEHSEKESDSSDSDSDEDADNQATTHRHMQSLNQIDNHVTNLMDLLPTLHYSSKIECHPRVEASQSMLQMSSELAIAARPYIVQVHDKFRNIDKDLANRIGEANWQRYLRVKNFARDKRGTTMKKSRLSQAQRSSPCPNSVTLGWGLPCLRSRSTRVQKFHIHPFSLHNQHVVVASLAFHPLHLRSEEASRSIAACVGDYCTTSKVERLGSK